MRYGARQGLALFLAFALSPVASALDWSGLDWSGLDWSGHAKVGGSANWFDANSVQANANGRDTQQLSGDFRFHLGASQGAWSWEVDYQLQARVGDLAPASPSNSSALNAVSEPWLSLDDSIREHSRSQIDHRLDRANLSYSGEKLVVRLGRQAISWGNGLMFNPVDVFNPFRLLAVDTEFKSGDDMLYAQWLFDSGDDLQFVSVARSAAGSHSWQSELSSHAVKYHGFLGEAEFDVLVAQHYDETLLAAGLVRDVGGAVVRSDLLFADTLDGWRASFVVNASYSWVWASKNISANAEYFYNGVGLGGDDHTVTDVFSDATLAQRLARGELFSAGRHNLGLSAQVEMHPLWVLGPNLITNLSDHSGMLQLLSSHDLHEQLRLQLSLNLPFGRIGTEFGGYRVLGENTELNAAPGRSVFAQLSWYF